MRLADAGCSKADLEKNEKTTVAFDFVTDSATIKSQSKDEFFSILGVLQSHPDWKLEIDVHMPSVGKAVHTQTLTQQRAEEIKKNLFPLAPKLLPSKQKDGEIPNRLSITKQKRTGSPTTAWRSVDFSNDESGVTIPQIF